MPSREPDLPFHALRAAGKDLDRTYLGLDADSCLACHADEHRKQFGDVDCENCHGMSAWRPSQGFDHQSTAYPLHGRHLNVECTECHPRRSSDSSDPYTLYRGIAHDSCSNCHSDPHGGRFGGTCSTCHSTAGWQRVSLEQFDHDSTRYPLRGAHRRQRCETCHRPGLPRRGISYSRCADCHDDVHRGQFNAREDRGACESCHTVERFTPSTFPLSAHEQTSYPLRGAHLATPCTSCHRRALVQETNSGGVRSRTVIQFRFPTTDCTACHQDPHNGETVAAQGNGGCDTCHTLAQWRQIHFDHGRTDFPLEGGHISVTCLECHPTVQPPGTLQPFIKMRGVSSACEGCHRDPHQGQLHRANVAEPCQRCHTVEDWQPKLFNHDRHSDFPLQGAHSTVPCAACHPRETIGPEATIIRYRPLPSSCADCHDPSSAQIGR